MLGRHATVYHPADYTKLKSDLAVQARELIKEGPLEGRLTLNIGVFVTKPKTSKLEAPSPDADNYAKGIMDALTQSGTVWKDDKQIVRLNIQKSWCDLGFPSPGFMVFVRPFDPVADALFPVTDED